MLNSMTGYGGAQGDIDGVSYAVEVRTVNNRYLKTVIKLPEMVTFLEESIERLLRKNLSRGTVNYVLRVKDVSGSALFDIDETTLRTVMEKLSRIGSSDAINRSIDMGSLLNLPGIIRPVSPDEETAERIRQMVLGISQKAIEKVKQMRAAEGSFLETDLKKHCAAIEGDIEQIRARSAAVLPEYAKRLRRRVDELLSQAELKLDEETLAREIAIFAERSDISEEIARLDSHLQQFAQSCEPDGQAAGRRLEFIGQEMLREANTIASKACDTEVTRCVVDMKCRIDRIREQVQNVE
jgi:uncharacterized protein (TIGR00255 family)